ncbi:hypothetical protein XENORESO_008080, partial [Xenotaenia resolanae]
GEELFQSFREPAAKLHFLPRPCSRREASQPNGGRACQAACAPAVKFRAFCGVLDWLKLDETNRKLPQHTSSFALLQKKEERSTGPRWASCRNSQWISSLLQTHVSPGVF